MCIQYVNPLLQVNGGSYSSFMKAEAENISLCMYLAWASRNH